MFYKKEGDNYFEGLIINLPDGTVLTSENRKNKDGWIWHDEPPMDFIDWQTNNLNELKTLI